MAVIPAYVLVITDAWCTLKTLSSRRGMHCNDYRLGGYYVEARMQLKSWEWLTGHVSLCALASPGYCTIRNTMKIGVQATSLTVSAKLLIHSVNLCCQKQYAFALDARVRLFSTLYEKWLCIMFFPFISAQVQTLPGRKAGVISRICSLFCNFVSGTKKFWIFVFHTVLCIP